MKARWVETLSVEHTSTLFDGVLGSYVKVRRTLVVGERVERTEGMRSEIVPGMFPTLERAYADWKGR